MENVLIITPVKDSIDIALQCIQLICQSKGEFSYLVYNDRSSHETLNILQSNTQLGYSLINIEEFTSHPSPNYRFTLIDAQQRALETNSSLIIVESDVFVKPETLSGLVDFAKMNPESGMVAAVTVNNEGEVNFPYLHLEKSDESIIETKHRVSFCCTLLTNSLLQEVDFSKLSEKKHWYDVQISSDSRKSGFKNYILTQLPVLHLPHSSRPWKKLKYSNPVKYYLRKWFLGKDKI